MGRRDHSGHADPVRPANRSRDQLLHVHVHMPLSADPSFARGYRRSAELSSAITALGVDGPPVEKHLAAVLNEVAARWFPTLDESLLANSELTNHMHRAHCVYSATANLSSSAATHLELLHACARPRS